MDNQAGPLGGSKLQLAYQYFQQGRLNQSETTLVEASSELAMDPKYWFLLGATRHRMGRLRAALADFDRSLELDSTQIQAMSARAQILFETSRWPEALEGYASALQQYPRDPRLLTNAALVLEALDEQDEALDVYTQALEAEPGFRDARLNRAVLNISRGQQLDALADYDHLLSLYSDDAQILANRADLLLALGRVGDARDNIERALKLDSASTQARFTHALILATLAQHEQAKSAYAELLQDDPAGVSECFRRIGVQLRPEAMDFRLVWFWAAIRRQQVCNWNDLDSFVDALDRFAEHSSDSPLSLLALPFSIIGLPVHPNTRLRIARCIAQKIDAQVRPARNADATPRRQDGRLHVAYIGSNFREHPNAYLTRRLFELHDREQFYISVYSLSEGDDSEVYAAIRAHSDAFVELPRESSREVAHRIHADGVQILVDVAMYSDGGRPDILAQRPAPVIASYLGTEMTSAADFVDYRISDRVLMQTDRENWVEKVVTLPGCCFPYNDAEPIDASGFTRAAAGLPEDAFVFCSFNNSYKIEPVVFGLWCEILQRVPASVLWILVNNPTTQANLVHEAGLRGIASDRLVFCGRETHARHLGRHCLADLFLDTLWYNAHTTAVESLWAGLPLISCAGQTTASRIGASVLLAAGLPELVTHSLDAYVELAVELATSPQKLAAIRDRLERNRLQCSLFDSRGSARKLEAAYTAMWQRHRQGLTPADIDIAEAEAAQA
jgi:protein O-GlcNAc transferase